MALPSSKQELADWILRRLGAPVVNVEITDVQLEDVIDEAVQWFQEWHYDGAERTYRTIKIEGEVLDGNNRKPNNITAPLFDVDQLLEYRVGDRVMTYNQHGQPDHIWIKYDSDTDVNTVSRTFESLFRKEEEVLAEPSLDLDYSKEGQVGIIIPENIIGVTKVFRIDNFSGVGMWNYEYQYMLNNFDFFFGNNGGSTMPLTNYYTTKSYLDLIDNMMNTQPAIRFSKHRNRLFIDTNWKRLERNTASSAYYLMIECYEANDPEIFSDVYKDKWLKRYATALAKEQWGSNLKKYSNTELPGGLMLDGRALYEEGKEERITLEEELKASQLEMDFIIG